MAAIDASKASGLFPAPLAAEIMKEMPKMSSALRLFKTRTMTSRTEGQPILNALPSAGFTDGDLGHAPVTVMEWKGKKLVSSDLKTSVVLPENVIKDSAYPLWDEIIPELTEAMGYSLDRATLFNIGAPASFGTGIVNSAIAAGNVYTRGTNTQADGGLYTDLLKTMRGPVADGYSVNGWIASDLFEIDAMAATDTTGKALMFLGETGSTLLRRPFNLTSSALWPQGFNAAEAICGDFTKGIIGIRQDIEYKFVTEGVVSNPVTGAVEINLPQQGAVLLTVKARYAFVLANPATRAVPGAEAEGEIIRSPFGVLLAPDDPDAGAGAGA